MMEELRGIRKKKMIRLAIIVILIIGMGVFAFNKLGSKIGLKKDIAVSQKQSVNVTSNVVVKPLIENKKNDVILYEKFQGIIEDSNGRTIITPRDRYVQGNLCRLGKVLFCYEDKILIAGFDKKPHMILPDISKDEVIEVVKNSEGGL